MILCRVTETVLVQELGRNKPGPQILTESVEWIRFPKLRKAIGMEKARVEVNGKFGISYNYQSVHVGVTLEITGMEPDDMAACHKKLQKEVLDRIEDAKTDAEEMLESLLDADEERSSSRKRR